MEALWSSLESRGLPKNVIELLLGAARLNTQSAYQSAWNAWNSWCIKRGVHSMSAAVNDVLSFLAEYFIRREKLQLVKYRTFYVIIYTLPGAK